MSKFFRTIRRISIVAVAVAAASIGTVVVAPAAQAAPPGCSMSSGYYIDGGQNIHSHRFWACDDGNDILLTTTVQRYVSPGAWTTVASGTGFATYYCNGHALNIYRVNGGSQFFNTCG